MKKCNNVLRLCLLLGMCLLFPLLLLLGRCFDFQVIVRNWGLHGVVSTAVFVFLSLPVLRCEPVGTTEGFLPALLFPAATVHAFFWVWGVGRFWLSGLLSLVWVGFGAVVTMKYAKPMGAKIVAYILSVLLLLPTLLGCLLLPFSIGQNTVTQTLISPEGRYRAEVIDSDQGALGGDTIVQVVDLQKQWDLLVFLIRKNPQRVFWGDWGEFMTMKLDWESEQVLRINGHPNKVE